ncbi:MAG: peptide-methionine (S)-S-oxide reductase MsrA [Firmicutes bacterium]|nr:peptide-methionine (S)-S-oxide reductase MsrA [Bacillota bacterium]
MGQGQQLEKATLAGGCFWCTEALFRRLKGVEKVEPGYSGGHTENPTYEQVCTGTTGHAEAVQITYDPQVISFRQLLEVFFTVHDPTTLNRQGEDVGTQYRSAIFYHSPEQKAIAEQMIRELDQSGQFASPVVTEVVPYRAFYRAEDYHLNFFERNPNQLYCRAIIPPKLAKLSKNHQSLLAT